MGYTKPFDPADVWSYATRKLTDIDIYRTVQKSSTELKTWADEETSTADISYEKLKEIKMYVTGTIRVKWKFRRDTASDYTVYTQVYKNGSAVGTEKSTTSAEYVEVYQDISVQFGDLVQLYGKTGLSGYPVYVKDFRIYYTHVCENEVLLD